jgi:hypothetical protein
MVMCEPIDDATAYEIRVRGHIDPRWSDWFSGLTIQTDFTPDGGPITTLTGDVADQSALAGILVQISDMNLALVSVNLVHRDQESGISERGQLENGTSGG